VVDNIDSRSLKLFVIKKRFVLKQFTIFTSPEIEVPSLTTIGGTYKDLDA